MKLLCFLFLFCVSFNVSSEVHEDEILDAFGRSDFLSALSLIKDNNIDINKRLSNGKLIADYILFTNYAPFIELYLRNGMEPNPTDDNFYLNQACLLGHTDTIKLLLDFGAPTEIWTDSYKTKYFGSPCIYFLISYSNDEAFIYYTKKAIKQHGYAFINNKLLDYIEKHKRSTHNIYEFVGKQQTLSKESR